MSDSSYPVYQHYGTNAARTAFTPAPPASGNPIYIWYESDTDKVFVYTTAWHQISSGTSGSAISALTGDVTATGPGSVAATIVNDAVTTAKIINDAVTYAKIQNISAASRILGRGSASGSGDTQELSANLNLAISSTNLNLSIPLTDDGNSSTALTIDFGSAPRSTHKFTLTGNVTLTFTNPLDGGCYLLKIATGAGSFTVTWPATVLWPGGTAPTITTTASKVDLVTLLYDSTATKYYGSFNQNF